MTHTASDIPGDPLNIALVGTEEDLIRAMNTARWDPANPLTFRSSSVRIVIDTMLRKPDDEAPVSNLYLFGRKEDLAFEKPVGSSPKERYHVRFWRMAKTDDDRPAWIGSAAYDIGVELSRTTGQVTHHISPNLDAERDLLVTDLTKSVLAPVRWLDGFHDKLQGRNGGGDQWRTDGRLAVVTLPLTQGVSSPTRRVTSSRHFFHCAPPSGNSGVSGEKLEAPNEQYIRHRRRWDYPLFPFRSTRAIGIVLTVSTSVMVFSVRRSSHVRERRDSLRS